MKKKITAKSIIAMIFSVALVCMTATAFYADGINQIEVYAQDSDSPEGGTVSGNTVPDFECTCTDRCTQYSRDETCDVCKEDYRLCEYTAPNVKISINTPSGWHNSSTKVHISVEDIAKSGNFTVKSVQAKVAQNGSWTDVTEDMYVEISENSAVYVLVKDQKDKTYEKNRYIKCFDFTAPTLNAAVNDGLLSIKAHDTDSGVKAVYVNGYEFTNLTNDTLNVRLEQFDTGYQYFSIQAVDNAGNMSEVYRVDNPYYKDPADTEGNEENPAGGLPVSAQATEPTSATAQVTEHTTTDSEGNTIEETNMADQEEDADKSDAAGERGKEFYTIQTASEKVFYLIIDKDGDEETVYFLTEIRENDLLNVTTDNSETLPKNSVALESAIPVIESALPGSEAEDNTVEDETEESDESTDEIPEDMEEETAEESPLAAYIILGIIGVGVIGAAYYFKVVRKKEDFLDEDDEEDEDEEYDDSDDEDDDSEEDFFDDKEDEAE